MKYHDYSLEGYSVCNHGSLITLHLSRETELSEIAFSDVILYHFIHTGGAILTAISEIPIGRLVLEKKDLISGWGLQHGGIRHWDDDLFLFSSRLVSLGYRAWTIESAIGFEAFVIAKELQQLEPRGDEVTPNSTSCHETSLTLDAPQL